MARLRTGGATLYGTPYWQRTTGEVAPPRATVQRECIICAKPGPGHEYAFGKCKTCRQYLRTTGRDRDPAILGQSLPAEALERLRVRLGVATILDVLKIAWGVQR